MFEKPFGSIRQKLKPIGIFACLSVVVFATSANAAEIKIIDAKGDAYAIVDAPAGSTFSVEAITTLDSSGTLSLQSSGSSLVSVKEVVHGSSSSGAVFNGIEAGTYTLVPSDSNIRITKVDVLSSSQVLGKGLDIDSEVSSAQSETSSISKSAYSVGAAAVAGALAIGASGGASGVISSGSSSGAGSARLGGALAGGTQGIVGQPAMLIQPRLSGAPGDPAVILPPSIPSPNTAPAVFNPNVTPTPSSPGAVPTPNPFLESPANQPGGNPNVMPPPPSKDPMTPS